MAKVLLQKIRLTGLRKHYKLLMQELHRKGVMEIVETPELIEHSLQRHEDHFGVFDLARIDFAIRLLSPYALPGKKLESLLSGGKLVCEESEAKNRLKEFSPRAEALLDSCEKSEEILVKTENEQQKIERRRALLVPYKSLLVGWGSALETDQTITWIGSLAGSNVGECIEKLALISHLVDIKILSQASDRMFVRVTALKSLEEEISRLFSEYSFSEVEWSCEESDEEGRSVSALLKDLNQQEMACKKRHEEASVQLRGMASEVENFKILYDYNSWRKRKNDLQYKIFQSEYLFAFEAWMPEKAVSSLVEWTENIFVGEVVLDRIEAKEGEEAPTLLQNGAFSKPFEMITEMYGIPGAKDIDPTPALSPFFFIFFGLCLSDVGYGGLLTLIMGIALIFGKFPSNLRNSFRAMLYCGIATIIGGVLLGGYFGMEASKAPGFMTTVTETAGVSTVLFKGQVLNPMEGDGPMTFLALALGLGMIQLLFGVFLEIVRLWKNGQKLDALCDPGAWLFFLIALVGFALAAPLGLSAALMGKLAIAGAVILVLTQGRSQKNWFLKPVMGVLGLYNITAYLSDILSYSRIMALGLATGVIGMAMNLTASVLGGLMPHPVLGFIVAVLILLFGHSLNFFLSLLGAFVHSGRLQFIEFFGKFYEGSGKKFSPFMRAKKYLFFNSSS